MQFGDNEAMKLLRAGKIACGKLAKERLLIITYDLSRQ
jgi:hypothetical protein